ncbi:alpha/beta fold hydrolase [Afifella sp. IM 167]|uniref:alpha/beta fold hydrolase n=1 Tax=Afifella sp. IM 167 TaxID=2033586 RepID=UPI001CCC9FA7|nr:alpha/beta hydrolase [Afifella sp. IM 167]MBZ8135213.1 hypothetical protein [Afifella sp. IM 167]
MLSRTATMMVVGASLLAAVPAHAQAPKDFAVETPDGVTIAAQEWGNPDGQEIVFIHGFMQSHLSWVKQVRDPELSKRYRMITYDFRGHGSSDKILDPELYNSSEKFADELDAVIKAAGLKKPVLVGWSYGSRIMMDYLRKYGTDHLSGLDFVGSAGNGNPDLVGRSMPLLGKALTENLEENIEATKAFIHACFTIQPTVSEFETMLGFNMMVPIKIRGWLRRPAPYEEALKAVTVPTLVTHGDDDAILGLGLGEYTAKMVPDARLSVYQGVGHSPFWEDAPRFNRELTELMDRAKS